MTDADLILKKLEEIERRLNPATWLTIEQAAKYLNISVSLIRRLIREGNIPYRRIPDGKQSKILFNRKQLDIWLLTGDTNPGKRQRLLCKDYL